MTDEQPRKQALTEWDLIVQVAKHLQTTAAQSEVASSRAPQRAHLDPICYMERPGLNLEQEAERKQLRDVNKVWAATMKSLKALCDQGKFVDLPLCGRFRRIDAEKSKVCFVPHLDFVASASFSFPENESNISPFAKSSEKNLVTVSLSSIAAVCKLDRETCGTILKEIFVRFVSLNPLT